MFSLFDASLFSFSPQFHYHNNNHLNPPIEYIKGNGQGWTKEVNGDVTIEAVPNRTTLFLDGAGAMKINGSLRIGGTN